MRRSQIAQRAMHGSEAPYRLLLLAGFAAAMLSVLAFVLWGVGGGGLLVDMIVAFCT